MDPGRGERPVGREHRRQPPVVRGQGKELVLAEVGFDLQDLAELADLEALAQFDHRRLEAALVAYAQRDAGFLNRGNGAPDIVTGQAKRLFAKHVFAGARSLLDLFGMEAVRRAQHHRVDIGRLQRGVKICCGAHAKGGRGLASGGFGVDAKQRADHVARGKVARNGAAPPAHADNGGAYHSGLHLRAGADKAA